MIRKLLVPILTAAFLAGAAPAATAADACYLYELLGWSHCEG